MLDTFSLSSNTRQWRLDSSRLLLDTPGNLLETCLLVGHLDVFVGHSAEFVGQLQAFVGHSGKFVGNLPVGWTLGCFRWTLGRFGWTAPGFCWTLQEVCWNPACWLDTWMFSLDTRQSSLNSSRLLLDTPGNLLETCLLVGHLDVFVGHSTDLVGQLQAFVGHSRKFVGNLPVGWTLGCFRWTLGRFG